MSVDTDCLRATPLATTGPKRFGGRDFLAFLLPLLIFVKLNVVGELFITELLLVGLLPFLLLSGSRPAITRRLGWLLVLGAVWLVSQMLTDAIQASEFGDYSRGWAKIAFTLTNLVALFLLIGGSRRRLKLFAAGYVVGATLAFYLNPGILAQDYPWKFGLAYPVTLATVLLATNQRVWKTGFGSSLVLFGISALNLFLGFRSLAGVCFVTGAYLMFQSMPRISRGRKRPTLGGVACLAIVGALAVLGSLRVYESSATSGLLGQKARQQYEGQSQGTLGILIGGRSEMLASFKAIQDSPILGHGSWAKDASYRRALDARLRLLGYNPLHSDSELIPSHSFLFGAWVEAGFLGALFWLAVLTFPVRAFFSTYLVRDPMSPLTIFVATSFVWDILFSPFGAQGRLLTAFYLVTLANAQTVLPTMPPPSGSLGKPVRSVLDD